MFAFDLCEVLACCRLSVIGNSNLLVAWPLFRSSESLEQASEVQSVLFGSALLLSPHSGLRTLCIAMTELEPEEFQRWSDIYYKASTSLENREKNVDDAAELIEKVSRLSINT